MPTIIQPTKHSVRAYLKRRSQASKPPPAPDEIRRQLGWCLALPGFKLSSERR